MSAFTVGKDHIDLLVTVAVTMQGFKPQYVDVAGFADRLGAELWAENFRSVNFRYTEDEKPPEYHWQPVEGFDAQGAVETRALLAVVGAANCYGYQTCEHPGWIESKAFWVTDAVQRWADSKLAAIGHPKEDRYRTGQLDWVGREVWVFDREEWAQKLREEA